MTTVTGLTPMTPKTPPTPLALERAADRAERAIAQATSRWALPGALGEAVRYAALGAGKRLRPALTFLSCESCGGAADRAAGAAAAVELIHAFSLVHDDLPGMDDDDLRRGRPTLHRHTTEAMAILAGDAMLNLALRLLVERVTPPHLAVSLTSQLAAATNAMIAGQVYDTLGGPDLDPDHEPDHERRLRLIHDNKTGSLITASCVMGAMIAVDTVPTYPHRSRTLESLRAYGLAIGLMFQIVDDLLDVTQTTARLGKKAGKDRDAGKLTYPGVLGIDASRQKVRELLAQALASLQSFGHEAEPLRAIAAYMAVRTR